MSPYQITLLVVAIATTLITAVLLVLQVIGIGIHDEFDIGGADSADGIDAINNYGVTSFAELKFLSFRGIMAFLCIGSWMTLAMTAIPLHYALATVIGVVAGAGANVGVAFFNRAMMRMRVAGNLEAVNAIGKTAEVYLTIPAKRASGGKVSVLVQERLAEFDAVTDNEEPIPTGGRVKITGVCARGTLVVENL